jgi:hypothetical protein
MTNDYPRGWYTYLLPDGEVLIPLNQDEETDSVEEKPILH